VVEIVSPVDGILVEILVPADEEAKTGDQLCVVEH